MKKETYHPYSSGVLALKAGILPHILVLIGGVCAVYGESVTSLAKFGAVFLSEVIFIAALSRLNDFEIKRAYAKLERDKLQLDEIIKTAKESDSPSLVAEIEAKRNKVIKDMASLYSNQAK